MSNLTTNESLISYLESTTEEINKVSPSFCLAKWLQSTLYLHNGTTHSCHHPPTHSIPLDEIAKSPDSLHNTSHKAKLRNQMLNGKRPKECQYCWNIEDLGKGHLSDRSYKSADSWAYPHLKKVLKSGLQPIAPTYLEVAFSSTCNFKCAYCNPTLSTKWMQEILQHGPYPNSLKTGNLDWFKENHRMPISDESKNPYIEAFWKWWPQVYPQLHTFRITGGEPLLSRETWKVLDEIEENPQSHLNLAINTNLGVSDSILERLIQKYRSIRPNINRFDIFTSCEAFGKQAEYVRYGLNYKKFMTNIERLLNECDERSSIHLMVTFNILSAPSFDRFLEDIWQLREKYNPGDGKNRIAMMINYLHWPPFMSMQILPKELKGQFSKKILEKIEEHSIRNKSQRGYFSLEEIDQVQRLCNHMQEELSKKDLKKRRKDFALFFQEYDKRKDLNFLETFPELEEFYKECLGLI